MLYNGQAQGAIKHANFAFCRERRTGAGEKKKCPNNAFFINQLAEGFGTLKQPIGCLGD